MLELISVGANRIADRTHSQRGLGTIGTPEGPHDPRVETDNEAGK